MTQLTCIICPKGCRLSVDDRHDYEVTGNGCARGAAYGQEELCNPVRVVTSTVRIEGAIHPRCPVKTDGSIPKQFVAEAMALLNGITLTSPVHTGDVVIDHICGTEVSFVVTKDMSAIARSTQ